MASKVSRRDHLFPVDDEKVSFGKKYKRRDNLSIDDRLALGVSHSRCRENKLEKSSERVCYAVLERKTRGILSTFSVYDLADG